MYIIAEEGRDGGGLQVPVLGGVAQRVQCGRVKAKLGRRNEDASSTASREGNVCNDALDVVGLCQEMHEALVDVVAAR